MAWTKQASTNPPWTSVDNEDMADRGKEISMITGRDWEIPDQGPGGKLMMMMMMMMMLCCSAALLLCLCICASCSVLIFCTVLRALMLLTLAGGM
ncbi:hypothetical protein V8E54_003495 [Elaphomyces granulatus]